MMFRQTMIELAALLNLVATSPLAEPVEKSPSPSCHATVTVRGKLGARLLGNGATEFFVSVGKREVALAVEVKRLPEVAALVGKEVVLTAPYDPHRSRLCVASVRKAE